MKKKKVPTWKQIIKKMDAGKFCTNDPEYKWLYGCWKAYNNPDNEIDNREKWWSSISKRFQNKLNKEYEILNND